MIELRTLGTLGLVGEDGADVVPVLAQSKRLALLVYLAVARPRGFHRRDALLALFWPERDEEHARSALRNALYFLRRSLGPSVIVNRGDTDVGVGVGFLRHDVADLEEALASEDYRTVLNLYRGDFLSGFHLPGCPDFDHWMDGERTRLREAAAAAAWSEASRLVGEGDLRRAEQSALRALALTPTEEKAARTFMEAMARAGDRPASLRFYETLAARLHSEVGVGPSLETKAVVDSIRANVRSGNGAGSGGSHAPPTYATRDGRPSLAVLPFQSLTGEPGAELFGLGVMDDILTRLGLVRGLRVVSRMSSMRYQPGEKSVPEIARELSVELVLEGSVRRDGDRVRVVAQLIDGTRDAHLWAGSYDRDIHDVFRVQTEIAESIVCALKAELSDEERQRVRRIPTEDLRAWEAYIRAVQQYQGLGPRQLAEAVEHLEEAVRLDPSFAQAWALIAQVLVLRGFCADESPSSLFPRIRHAAISALKLNPNCGEAHAALGVVELFHAWQPQEAGAAFLRALNLNPDDTLSLGWWAIFLALRGDAKDAVVAARHTVATDPLSAAAHLVLGQVLVMAGEPGQAIPVMEAGLRQWPQALQLHMWLGLAHVSCGTPDKALPHYEAAVELSGGLPHFQALRATALVLVDRADEARRVLETLEEEARSRYVDPYTLFSLALVLDGPDAAARYLEGMLNVRSVFLPYLRAIPRFRSLRGLPRFREALDRVWPETGVGATADV